MAKSNRGGRGNSNTTANGTLPRPTIRPLALLTISTSETLNSILPQLEDRRLYSPDYRVRAPGSVQRKNARLVQDQKDPTLRRYMFADPSKVAMCIRRKVRREVLHALKVAGGKGIKKYRRNFWSNVGC